MKVIWEGVSGIRKNEKGRSSQETGHLQMVKGSIARALVPNLGL